MTMWHMRTACSIPKATDTYSDCVTVTVFPLQQWLHEPLHCYIHTNLTCLVLKKKLYLATLFIEKFGYFMKKEDQQDATN